MYMYTYAFYCSTCTCVTCTSPHVDILVDEHCRLSCCTFSCTSFSLCWWWRCPPVSRWLASWSRSRSTRSTAPLRQSSGSTLWAAIDPNISIMFELQTNASPVKSYLVWHNYLRFCVRCSQLVYLQVLDISGCDDSCRLPQCMCLTAYKQFWHVYILLLPFAL